MDKHTHKDRQEWPHTFPALYLFVTEVMHSRCHIHRELKQLLRGEGRGSAMLFCKGRVSLQHTTLPQEVKKVTIGSIFNGYVQVAWRGQRDRGCSFWSFTNTFNSFSSAL